MTTETPETKTRRELIDPALKAAGWDKTPHSITPEETITDGRVIFPWAKRHTQRRFAG